MSRQLTFDLGRAAAQGAAEFFVSPANRQAHDMVMAPDTWPLGKLALIGPPASGKSHLARIWSSRHAASLIPAADVATLPRPAPGACIAVEDADTLPPAAEEPLFHLHNLIAAQGGRLLLTAQQPPARWSIRLPDLASRMQATTIVRIGDPDDALIFALFGKLFADRQLSPDPDVIPWLLLRVERSHAAVRDIVARLDAAALSEGRAITRAFARRVLDNIGPDTA